MSIGIFDSGFGGLTLLHRAKKMLPEEDYLFYADQDHVPYGMRSNEEILRFTGEALEFMIANGCTAVVIACNTATAVAAQALRQQFSIPILGIEPAVKPAVTHSGQKRVMVMATPVTIREEKLHNLIDRLDSASTVDLLAMPGLVELAEREAWDTPETLTYLQTQLKPFRLTDYSALVLGCTHFNYFKDKLAALFPAGVSLLDGSGGTIRHLREVLSQQPERTTASGRTDYYISGRRVTKQADLQRIARYLRRLDAMLDITQTTGT